MKVRLSGHQNLSGEKRGSCITTVTIFVDGIVQLRDTSDMVRGRVDIFNERGIEIFRSLDSTVYGVMSLL